MSVLPFVRLNITSMFLFARLNIKSVFLIALINIASTFFCLNLIGLYYLNLPSIDLFAFSNVSLINEFMFWMI